MDPGTALAVVGLCGQLFGACTQGYDIFSDAQNFGTDYGDFCLDLIKERGRLEKWVKAWKISDDDGDFHRKLNPEDWEYRYAVGALARICGLFTDLKNLDSTYGVRVAKSKESRRLRLSRWTKSFLKYINSQPHSLDKSQSSVSQPQHTSSFGSSSRMRLSSPSVAEDIPTINANIIAHLENLPKIEAKALPPDLSLTDEFTRLSDATAEFQKMLLAYKKYRWAICDKGKSEQLIQQLTKYNDGLYQILPLPNLLTTPMEPGTLSSATNKHYTVPFNSTAIFTGRSDIIEEIHQHFSVQASSDAPREQRRYVLFGMGGSGKTQIAIKFAEYYRDSFWAILWVDATTHETAEKGFRDIARIAKVEENVKAAQQWLTRLEEEWLLIIDNADDPALDISEYFPTGNRGNILVTTRNPDCWKYGPESHHEIREMNENDAVALLLKASKTKLNKEAVQWASQIVKELGFLALAIDQAGAYIANSCEIHEYLDIYKQHRKELLLRTSAQGGRSYKETVYTTWEVAFQKVQEENPIAADILQVFAFLHHEGISEEIFQRASLSFPSWEASDLYTVTGMPEQLMRILQLQHYGKSWERFRFRNDVDALLRYSLVRREKNTYSVHPLVHSWARDRLGKQEQQLFLRLAICLLSHSITFKFKTEDYAFRRQLLPHIDASRIRSADLFFDSETDLKQVIYTTRKFGLVYSEMGRLKEVEQNAVQTVKASETIFGKEHPQTLTSMLNLATTYRNQGRWKEAEKVGERVVEARERILGKEHPNTLASMNNLATTYMNQGRWKEAEKIGERVVEATERILGKEHPDTLTSMSNLASTYWNQGRWNEAEKMEERVVELRQRISGKEHPNTLASMSNLASTYLNQGRWKEAEKMEERVVEASKRILGKDHPDTLTSMGILASMYKNQGRLKEAEKMEERVVEARERILGKEHPNTLTSMHNLASTYKNQGRLKEAEKMEERVVEATERILGKGHPNTLRALDNLAAMYRSLGRLEEAKEIEVRAAEARRL